MNRAVHSRPPGFGSEQQEEIVAQRPAGKKQQSRHHGRQSGPTLAKGPGGQQGTAKQGAAQSAGKSAAQQSAVKKTSAGRASVAAARKSSNNRTQLIIGGLAIALIAAIVVAGVLLNKKNTETKGNPGYRASVATASLQDGVISVASGNPAVAIDIFEDAMCPACAGFEKQFGKQIAELADQGKVRVNFHMLNFLNGQSASKDYSTRALAALLAATTEGGNEPGMVLRFHELLFAAENQPREGGDADLTNGQLADLARTAGASTAVQASIGSGKYVGQAETTAKASMQALQTAVGEVRTPTVLSGGKPVQLNSGTWLTDLIG